MNNQTIQPIFIMPEGSQRTTGRDAQHSNITAAKAVAETVRTTLGPKGMDKMLVDSLGDIVITNDGVTILQQMEIEHPAAKMIVEIAKTQEEEVGDGTTTAVVLAGDLLKRSETLIEQNVHPSVITKGFTLAAKKAIEIIKEIAEPIDLKDKGLFKKIALTAMTGKSAENARENLANIIVDAVMQVMEEKEDKIIINRNNIKLEKKAGGEIEDSELIKGVLVDKERVNASMPSVLKDAKVLLIDRALEVKDTETDTKISVSTTSQMEQFLEREEKILRDIADKIIKSGANAVFCQKGIDDIVQFLIAKAGILAVRRVKKSDMDHLALATGARVLSEIKEIAKEDIGFAGLIEEKRIAGEEMTFVRDCKNPKAVTLLIRGSTEHVIDEVERAMTDAIKDIIVTIEMKKACGGGGAPEMELSKRLHAYAGTLSGREQLAVSEFAKSFEIIPRTLVENAGLDPITMMAEIKSAHEKGDKWAGIDVFDGKIKNMWKEGVIEPLKIKTQAISSASETAIMILRIDDVIASGKIKGREGGMPSGMGGMEGMM